jgi:DNA-binding beta-propeller fold protein YncE
VNWARRLDPRQRVIASIAVVLLLGLAAAVIASRAEPQVKEHVPLSSETIEVGDGPVALGYGASGLWVANSVDRTLQSVDTGSGEVVDTIRLGMLPGAVAVDENYVWVGSIEGREIDRVDPAATGTARRTRVEVGPTPQSLALDGTSVWVAASIWQVDAAEATVIGEPVQLREAFPSGIVVGFGSLWLTDVNDNSLLRLSMQTGEVEARIPVGNSPIGVVVTADALWVANYSDATVTRVDPVTEEAVGQPVILGGRPGGIAAGEGYIWVTRTEDSSLVRIDPETNEWTGEVFETGEEPLGVAVGDGSVWVADRGDDTLTRFTSSP